MAKEEIYTVAYQAVKENPAYEKASWILTCFSSLSMRNLIY